MRDLIPNALALDTDVDFKRMISAWCLTYKYTGMWCERLLARFRQASADHKDADCERMCSSGFLAQVFSEHMRRGREDPRATTRQSLLEDGLQLVCKKGAGHLRQRGTFVNFMMKAEAARREANLRLSLSEYKLWRQRKKEEFAALSEQERALELAESKASLSRKADVDEEDNSPAPGQAATSSVVDAVGDKRQPYTVEAFNARIRQQLGMAPEDKPPGFTRYTEDLRKEQIQALFVPDRGAIPKAQKFAYYLPCGLAHPGLCAQAHAFCIRQAKGCANELYKVAQQLDRGSFVYLRFVAGRAWQREAWAAIAYVRGSGPRLVMLAACTLRGCHLSADVISGSFCCMMAVTFVGLFFKEAPRGADLEVYWASPQLAGATPESAAEALLPADWRQRMKLQRLYPPKVALRAPAADPADVKMRRGLQRASERLPKKESTGSGVRMVRPRPPREPLAAAHEQLEPHDEDEDTTDNESDVAVEQGIDSEKSCDDDDGEGAGGGPDLAGGPREPAAPEVVAPLQPQPVQAEAQPGLQPPIGRDGRPWSSWLIGEHGWIVYDERRQSLGAHCNVCTHGQCRANKVCKRLPLGYLIAWLWAGHEEGCDSREAHVAVQRRLCSEMGLAQRQKARRWLLEREDAFRDLLDLERKHHKPGEFEEPLRVAI